MILILVQPRTQDSLVEKEILSLIPKDQDVELQTLWYPLQTNYKKKTPPKISDARMWAEEHIEFTRYSHIIVCDPIYFKALYKAQCKPDKELGYIREAYNTKLLYSPSVGAIFYNPDRTREQIKFCINSLVQDLNNKYQEPGQSILKEVYYPKTNKEIAIALNKIISNDMLACDIETYSLRHWDAGIASISFATDEHSGIAFKVDTEQGKPNKEVRDYLRQFFEARHYLGKPNVFHNICFDAYVLIYILWMNEEFCNWKGLLKGLKIMLEYFEDTKLISYLATNSASGNHLSLKEQAFEFAGNWGLPEDKITELNTLDENILLSYNLTDSCATIYVYKKNYPIMVHDNQEEIYKTIFKPACADIIQMQLTGMPIDMNQVNTVDRYLNNLKDKYEKEVLSNSDVKQAEELIKESLARKKNLKLKTKRVTAADIKFSFMLSSPDQLITLVYTVLGFECIEKTNTGKPATGQDTLESLAKSIEPSDDRYSLLMSIVNWQKIVKITNTFLKAFKQAPADKTGQHWLCGKFNLGGTVSGRLSSSEPNMQNLPSGSEFAKLIKSCFRPPKGYLMVGLDFASLEDHISALTTKDNNKLKVYTDGYDGHCLRAYHYWSNEMPDITAQLEEIKKEGKIFKVTKDDGTIEYLNEFNPKLKEYQNA